MPLADVNPTRRRPWVTWALVAINLVVAALTVVTGPDTACDALTTYARFGLVPSAVVGAGDVTVGGCDAVTSLGPWTVLTHMFVHAGWLHVGANLLYLWVFGDNVEDRLGHGRFAVLYLGSGVAAAIAQVVVGGGADRPLVGASGAVAGVLGAYLVSFPRARVASLLTFPLSLLAFVLRSRLNLVVVAIVELPAWLVLLGWAWAQLQGLSVPTGGVAYAAHVGGFAAGIVLLLRLRRGVADLTPTGRVRPGRRQ